METISYKEARKERRELKQKLFKIRLSVENGEELTDPELIKLKEQYELEGNFTSWKGFPESWDIGDPHGVKKNSYTFNEIDRKNVKRIQNKGYDEIVILSKQPPKEVVVTKGDKKITYKEPKS